MSTVEFDFANTMPPFLLLLGLGITLVLWVIDHSGKD